jgi:hypothetical protein
VASSSLSTTTVGTVVAVNNQASAPAAATTPPSQGFSLANLDFTDTSNFYARFLASTLAQATPDANNLTRYMDRRYNNVAGNMAKWSTGSNPSRQSDLSWDGSAWSACGLEQANTATVRDAQGNSSYNYCNNRETGTSNRAVFDIAGQTMLSVYNSMVAGGYTNIKIANAAAALGSAVFPADSKQWIQSSTPLTNAIAYYPGASYPAGTSNVVTQYSTAVAAGGVTATQAAGVGCNSVEWTALGAAGVNSTTFETMTPVKGGTPCINAANGSPFTYNTVAYNSGPTNEAWGNSTVNMGVLGNVALNTGTAPGYYSGNTAFRAAFTGANAVTYYACQQRFTDGSPRNCGVPIGTGTYTISTLGDARVMQFNNLPAQMSQLSYTTVLVERGGKIYRGYKNRPLVTTAARLNGAAAVAMLTQMGLSGPFTMVDPIVLTPASYRGSYAATSPSDPAGNGTILTLNGNLTSSCYDLPTKATTPCTLTITNPATGAFTMVNGSNTSSGTVNFMTGAFSGTWTDGITTTPFVGQRV